METQSDPSPIVKTVSAPDRGLPTTAPITLSAVHGVDSPLVALFTSLQQVYPSPSIYATNTGTIIQVSETRKEVASGISVHEERKIVQQKANDYSEKIPSDLQQSYLELSKVTVDNTEVLKDLATRVRKLDAQNYEIVDVLSKIKEEVDALKSGITKSTYFDHKQSLLSATTEVKGFEGNVPSELLSTEPKKSSNFLRVEKKTEKSEATPIFEGYRPPAPISVLQNSSSAVQDLQTTTARPMSSHKEEEQNIISAPTNRSISPSFVYQTGQPSMMNASAQDYVSYQPPTLPHPTVTSVRRSLEPRNYPLYTHTNASTCGLRGNEPLYTRNPPLMPVPVQGFYPRTEYSSPLQNSYLCGHYCQPQAPVETFTSYVAPYHIHHQNTSTVSVYSTLNRASSLPAKDPSSFVGGRARVEPEGVPYRKMSAAGSQPSTAAANLPCQSMAYPAKEAANMV